MTGVNMRDIESDEGDLMTVAEFVDCVRQGVFIDYDGHGRYATATQVSRDQADVIYPSELVRLKTRPSWCTHVMWYNK